MIVRRYVPADFPRVLDMARAMHAESPNHSPYPFDTAKVGRLIGMARQSPDWLALVAQDEDLVGFALVTAQPMYYSNAIEVMDLAVYVLPEYRGTRAGLKLIARIEQWAAQVGAARLSIGINTGIANERNERLLHRLGYETVGFQLSKSVH